MDVLGGVRMSCCHGCTKRHVGCRTTCPDWDEEQLAKELRYMARETQRAAAPWHQAVSNMIDRRRRKTQVRNAGRP